MCDENVNFSTLAPRVLKHICAKDNEAFSDYALTI